MLTIAAIGASWFAVVMLFLMANDEGRKSSK